MYYITHCHPRADPNCSPNPGDPTNNNRENCIKADSFL